MPDKDSEQEAAPPQEAPRPLPHGTMRPADAIVLTGFLASSSRAGHRRLYLDEELKEHVEIPDGDLRHLEWVEGARSLFGRRATLWIRQGATLDYTIARR